MSVIQERIESYGETKKEQRVLFYLPGTAGLGHLSRAITLATALRRLDPTVQILLITEAADTRLAKEAHFVCLSIASIAPYIALLRDEESSNGLSAQYRLSVWQSLIESAMASFHPTIVVHDTYIMEPVKKAAQKCNAVQIGVLRQSEKWQSKRRDNHWLQGLDLVLIPHSLDEHKAIHVPGFPPERVYYTGNLVRRTGSEITPAALRMRYDLNDDEFVIVVTNGGGNQPIKKPSGEPRQQENFLQSIVQAVSILRTILPENQRLRIIFITGPLASGEHSFKYNRKDFNTTFSVQEYEPYLPDLLAAAHATICRGGYNTISEVMAIGVPTLVIPVLDIFDDQEQRIAWAMTKHSYLQACSLDPTDIATRLQLLIEQPWWHFAPVSPAQDLLVQWKLEAAKKILNCTKLTSIH